MTAMVWVASSILRLLTTSVSISSPAAVSSTCCWSCFASATLARPGTFSLCSSAVLR